MGFATWTRSMKTSPGSPDSHAAEAMRRKRSRASTSPTGIPPRGWRRARRPPAAAARMNSSVTATEMLKFCRPGPRFDSTNSITSGWSTRSTAMLAPRRTPPCLMVSVAAS